MFTWRTVASFINYRSIVISINEIETDMIASVGMLYVHAQTQTPPNI